MKLCLRSVVVGNEFAPKTGRTGVNWLNLDKLINLCKCVGVILHYLKEDILLKIGKYMVIKNDKLIEFNSLSLMKGFIKRIKNDDEVDKIIFSNNPEKYNGFLINIIIVIILL